MRHFRKQDDAVSRKKSMEQRRQSKLLSHYIINKIKNMDEFELEVSDVIGVLN